MTNEAAAALVRAIDLPTFAPVLARVGGVMTFFPLLGAEVIPVRFRILVAASLAWILRPFVPAAAIQGVGGADPGLGAFIARIAGELLVGAALGFSAHVALAAFEAAGQLVGFQMGFTLSGIIDPFNGEQASALPVLYRIVAIALYFTMDAHHVFVHALRDSYTWIAPGAAHPAGAAFAAVAARVSGGLFLLAIRIAAPALVISILIDVALLLSARALPQVNLLLLGYPLKFALGFLAVATGLVVTPRIAAESLRLAVDQAHSFAAALAGGR